MATPKWPKTFPALTAEQQKISDDFMKHWHEVLGNHSRFSVRILENFNQLYALKHRPANFLSTLEIGAGLGEHLKYEQLTPEQKKHYVALEFRENMAQKIQDRHPEITTLVSDCQKTLPYADGHFDRILAIHVLEHLPNLPAAIREMHRLCNKKQGYFSVVIPCEGGLAYSLLRKISAQRIFERIYRQSYRWLIEREHINQPHEILEELAPYFSLSHRSFFPLLVPSVHLNICIGLTLHPK